MSRIWSYAVSASALLLALLGCGGGGSSDPITGIIATNFKYGQLTTLTLTGNALDNLIKLSSDKCIAITLGPIESSSTRKATCIVTATGPIQFTVKSNADYVVYQTSLIVPVPVTDIEMENFNFGKTAILTLKGDPQLSALRVTSDKCSNMVLDAVSDSATRTARCTVSGSGPVQFNVTNSTGSTTFYTQTVAAQAPVTGITFQGPLTYQSTVQLTIQSDPLSVFKVSSDQCSNMDVSATNGPTRTTSCTINGSGPIKFNVTDSTGKIIAYSQTIEVPHPRVTMVTSLAPSTPIVIELYPSSAPVTVANFLNYVKSSFYNGTIFHRVLTGSIAQGGGYTSGFVAKTGQSSPITLEVGKGLSNIQGTIAMARTSVLNSATSQFFFNARDNISYDTLGGGYAVFGKVMSGLDLIIQISNLQASSERPDVEVIITSATQTQ